MKSEKSNSNFFFPLSSRIILSVYILVFAASWACAWHAIKSTRDKLYENTVDSALNEQFRIGYAMKKMAENLYYSKDDAALFLHGTIRNSADSYAAYYAAGAYFQIVDEENKTSLFSNIQDEYLPALAEEIAKDGTVISYVQQVNGVDLLFVSSYIKIYESLFRLDYIEDISFLATAQQELSKKIALTLFGTQILLLIFLYILIKKVLKPLGRLNSQARAIAGGDYSLRVPIRHNDEVGQLSESFNIMAEAVERHVQHLSKVAHDKELFASNVAHEIKTPITSIVAYSDYAVKSQSEGEGLYRQLEYIKKEGQRLSDLSEKILDWRSLDKRKITAGPCKTDRIIAQVLYTLKPMADKRGQKISVTQDIGLFYADETLIISLIVNLIKNALNASADGDTVQLDICKDAEYLKIIVRDHGIGMDESEIEKITAPFYMVDKSRDRAKGGSGLGLALCLSIAKAHNGVMKIESAPGKGASVTVRIPQ